MTPATPTPSPRRRPRGEQTAESILDAAEALFAERGFAGTTLRDVAERVGVRIPSLYNHFESKDALSGAVLQRGIQPVLELLNQVLEANRGDAPDSASVVEPILALLEQHPNLPRLIQYETLAGGERLRPILQRSIAPVFESAKQLIERSPGAPSWEPEQIPLLVLALYHAVAGYFTIAPLYAQLAGEDLLARDALDRHTRFFTELAARLLGPAQED
jgi:AcrR family transcriptional regulator